MDKQSLRKWIRGKRKEIDMEHISSILADKLAKSNEYKSSKNIMIYYPLKNEVNLLSLLNNKTKNFYLPRIKGYELECCPYKFNDKLKPSSFHTLEPVCNACGKTELDMVIVPALAVDKEKYRLGYGGGFYDRFLKDFTGLKIVCIPQMFVFENVYKEPHDIKMDVIVTELSNP